MCICWEKSILITMQKFILNQGNRARLRLGLFSDLSLEGLLFFIFTFNIKIILNKLWLFENIDMFLNQRIYMHIELIWYFSLNLFLIIFINNNYCPIRKLYIDFHFIFMLINSWHLFICSKLNKSQYFAIYIVNYW